MASPEDCEDTTPDREMFVVHAKGNSMLPKIKDGDLCVFERYHGGSREGEIVLSQVNEYYEEYGGKYTIKKFHSEKTVNEEGGGSSFKNRIAATQ